jgi:uncharacterized membrane protein YbhN (UPF0104 family)
MEAASRGGAQRGALQLLARILHTVPTELSLRRKGHEAASGGFRRGLDRASPIAAAVIKLSVAKDCFDGSYPSIRRLRWPAVRAGEPRDEASRMKLFMRIPRWLKAVVGFALIGVLLVNVDWATLGDDARSLRWPLLGAAALMYPLAILLNAAKWSAALRLHDLNFRFSYLLRTGCIGFFVNNLLPSAIGGDVYRVYRSSSTGTASQAISAVVLERLVGVAVLLFNGFLGALVLAHSSALARAYLMWCSAALVVAGAGAALVVACRGRAVAAASKVRFLQPVIANLRRIGRLHEAWGPLIGYSIAFQAVAVAATFLVFAAVNAELSLAGALLITAAGGLAAVVPISISGIGVVEGSIIGASVALGVGFDAAFLAAIILRLFSLVTSVGCGVVYVLEGGRQSMQPA